MPETTGSIYEGTYFRVEIPRLLPNGNRPRDIPYMPQPNVVIPAGVANLQLELDKTLSTLSSLFPSSDKGVQVADKKYNEYFDKLAGIAALGLGQDQASFARLALDAFRDEVRLREAGRIKNAYVKRLAGWASAFVLALGTFYLLIRYGWFPESVNAKREFLTLVAASCFGTCLSFAIRKVDLKFNELTVIEDDQLDPPIRLLFVAGFTLVIGLVFSTKLSVINIGSFNTNFLMSGSHAALIGVFCGIVEHGLSTTVGARANEFIGRLNVAAPSQASSGTAVSGPTSADATISALKKAASDASKRANDARIDAETKRKAADNAAQKAATATATAKLKQDEAKAASEAASKADAAVLVDPSKKAEAAAAAEAAKKASDAAKSAEEAERATRLEATTAASTAKQAETAARAADDAARKANDAAKDGL